MLIIFILLNLLMIFSSHLAAFYLNKGDNLSGQTLTTFLFYITQVSFSVLILGAFVKNLDFPGLILLNSAISAAVIAALRKSIKTSLTETFTHLGQFSQWLIKSRDYFLYLFLFLFFLQVAATVVKIYYLPPSVGDVFSYHLHPLADWYQQGQILSYTDTPVVRANENPLGTKLIHFWFVKFFGDITWIELPQFLFGIFLCLSAYTIMGKMNLQKKNALRYAILVYFIPTVLLQTRTCQDHLAFAACIFFALNYLIAVIYQGRQQQVLPLFIALGLLFGIKKHAALVILVLFLSLLLNQGFNRRQVLAFIKKNYWELAAGVVIFLGYTSYFLFSKENLYHYLWVRYSRYFTPAVLVGLILGVLILILLWRGFKRMVPAVRDSTAFQAITKKRRFILPIGAGLILLILSGLVIKYREVLKPFFLGHTSPLMMTNRRHFAAQYPAFNYPLIKNLLAFPFRVKDIGLYTAYTPDLLEQSGFGPQFFALGLLAYLILIPRWIFKKEYRNCIMGFLLLFSLLLLAAYFLVYFSWANYRSFLFFGVIGLLGWCFLVEKLALKRFALRSIDGLLVVMILFSAVTCFFEGNMSAKRWKTLLTLDNALERTSIKYSSLMDSSKGKKNWDFIDGFIGPDDAIAFSSGGAAWIFPYFDNQLQRRIYFLKSLPGFATVPREKNSVIYNMLTFSPDFIASLKQRGIRFIHLNNEGTPFKQKVFMPEGVDNVYRVSESLYFVKWE